MIALEWTYERLSRMQATMNSEDKAKGTGLFFCEVFVVAEVVAEVTTSKVLHGKIKMLSVLEGVDGVNYEGIGHFIEEEFFVDDGIYAFLHDDSKMIGKLLGFRYLFHCVYLLGLLVLDFPDTAKPP